MTLAGGRVWFTWAVVDVSGMCECVGWVLIMSVRTQAGQYAKKKTFTWGHKVCNDTPYSYMGTVPVATLISSE